jgi:ribosomal peptide maturation radical SAM protein 1
MRSPEVILVNMPWAPMIQPSLALGLLQAILRKAGLTCLTMYANLDFTAMVGEESYRTLIRTMSSDGLRDWTFGPPAFPDFHPADDEYLQRVYARCTPVVGFEIFSHTARSVRSAAGTFTRELAAEIVAREPRIVGCTSSMNQHVASLALLREIRALNTDIITLMGGANCEDTMGGVTHEAFPWIDYLVSGEADGLIVPLVRRIAEHGRHVPLEQLPAGVLGPLHRTGGYPPSTRAVFDQLEELPLPDFEDYFTALAASPSWLRDMILPSLPVETSRGCWWGRTGGCSFCGIDHAGRSFVSKSAERALREFDALEERYHTGRIQTSDNVMDPHYYESMLPRMAEEPRSYRLFYEIRPTREESHVEQLAAAGVRWIWAGIESLHSKTLDLAHKGLSAWENLQFLKACRRFGIFAGWNLMCDFPGEDDDWYLAMARTMARCTHLQPPAACTRVRFDRFSDYHRHPGKYGLELHPAGLSRFLYPMSAEQLERQVYFFEDAARRENPLFDALLDRPGIRGVSDAANAWRTRFHSGNPACLELTDDGEVCRIVDSRQEPTGSTIEIRGLERDLLLACDRAPAMGELLSRSAHPAGEPDRSMEKLVDLGLVLLIDGRAVSLPLREPVMPLPRIWEYPGGGLVSPAMRRRIENQANIGSDWNED